MRIDRLRGVTSKRETTPGTDFGPNYGPMVQLIFQLELNTLTGTYTSTGVSNSEPELKNWKELDSLLL